MRALGLDLGTRRIGVALSTSDGTLATPYEVVQRSGDVGRDHRRICELAREAEAVIIVIGLPLHLDGRESEGAKAARREAAEIAELCGLPVETYDERLTTVTAQRSMADMSLTPRNRKRVVDQLAATIMLQAWLDHLTNSPRESE